MACKFTCFLSFTNALKENDIGVFQSDNGELYRVKYKSNVCRDLLLSIDWTVSKKIFFAVKLYNTTFKRCIASKGMIVNGKKAFMKVRGAFNVSNSRNYNVLCVINLIPYITFNDCNELSSESCNDSGFIKSESNGMSIDGNNDISEETEYEEEDKEESSCDANNIALKVKEVTEPSKRVCCRAEIKEKEYEELHSNESNIQLDETTITDDTMIVGSVLTEPENVTLNHVIRETSELLMCKESLSSSYQSEKIENENVYESFESEEVLENVHNFETEKQKLENNFKENSTDGLSSISDKPTVECVSSNNTCTEINVTVKISKIPLLDDYSEEIIENINAINIHNDLDSNDTFSENNTAMDVDLSQSSFINHSVPNEEDNLLTNSCSKESKESSTNNVLTINQVEKSEFNELSGNNERSGLHDIKTVKNCEDIDAMSINNNEPDKKDPSILSNSNICTYIQHPDTPKKYKDVNSSTSISNSSPINIPKLSEYTKDAEINNTKINNQKSETPKLQSSKTSLVFQTLVKRLSMSDNELELTDRNQEVASSSNMNIKRSPDSEVDKPKIFPLMQSELKGLSVDMLELLTSGDMADATITNGEKNIKVHRVIVSARSTTLKKLFTKHEQDDIKYQAVVDIPSYIFEDFVIFLYVGLVYIKNRKMARDLHQAAEKYSINDLIDICSKLIQK